MGLAKNLAIGGLYLIGAGILARGAGVDPLFLFRERGTYSQAENFREEDSEIPMRNSVRGKNFQKKLYVNPLQKKTADLRKKNLQADFDVIDYEDYLWEARQQADRIRRFETEKKTAQGQMEIDKAINDWWEESNASEMNRMLGLTEDYFGHQSKMADARQKDEGAKVRKKYAREFDDYQKSREQESNSGKPSKSSGGWFGGLFGK